MVRTCKYPLVGERLAVVPRTAKEEVAVAVDGDGVANGD